MACMGPSKKYADERAEKALLEIKELLKSKHGLDLDGTFGWFMKDFNNEKKEFIDAIYKLFWTDECNRF